MIKLEEDWQFVESKFWLLQPLETLISRQELRFFTLTNIQIVLVQAAPPQGLILI